MPAAGFDHELVWLAVSVAALAGGAVWISLGLSWSQCPFLAMTGWPCMTCGTTRASVAFLHGKFLEAFWWNPLAAVVLGALVVFDLYAVTVLVRRAPRVRLVEWTGRQRTIAWIVLIVAVLSNWVYLLAHRVRF
jgi:hypothetical protein